MRPTTRLRLTALERRDVPAVFNIANGDIAALAAAITTSNVNNESDTIRLAANGTYAFTAVGDTTSGPSALPGIVRDTSVANTLTIEGNGSTLQRTAGSPAFRFLRVGVFPNLVSVTVTNTRFTNGDADTGNGGAIVMNAGDLTLQGCTFDANRGTTGGAVYATNTTNPNRLVSVVDSTFTQNLATGVTSGAGGAVYLLGSTNLSIAGSTFTGNTSTVEGGAVRVQTSSGTVSIAGSVFATNTANGGNGGGAIFVQGPTTVTNTTVRDNVSAGGGGGIWVQSGGALTMTGSTVSGNRADRSTASGGGVFCQGALAVVNSTIHGNRAGNGGGIAITSGATATASVRNSTVTDNRAFFSLANAGGIAVDPFSTLILGNTAVAGNVLEAGGTAPDVGGSVASEGYNLIQNPTGAAITGTTTGNITGIDPQLGPLQNNGGPTSTRSPLATSALINAGDPAFASPPATDQRGLARVAGNRLDIGAVEVQATATRVTGVAVNVGQANTTQRSRVTSLTVTFDSVVTFAGPVAAAFTVSRINGSAVGGFTASAATVGGVTVATLTGFTGTETEFGSLADGRYVVTVLASPVPNLDGDGNGTPGDDYVLTGTVANGLFRLFGDVNGDGSISGGDFGTFRLAFGTSTGQAGYVDFLDYDGNGSISGGDFGQFRVRFGTGVP